MSIRDHIRLLSGIKGGVRVAVVYHPDAEDEIESVKADVEGLDVLFVEDDTLEPGELEIAPAAVYERASDDDEG